MRSCFIEICGNVLLWLKNFFTGKTHQTRVDSSLSDLADLSSGIIQGSGIGPVMFLSYNKELIALLETCGIVVKAFADDVKIYVRIVNDVNLQLQHAIDSLVRWAEEWQLTVSVDKCCVLNIGHLVLLPELMIQNEVLPNVNSVRDLGINVTNYLSPSDHVCDMSVVILQITTQQCRNYLHDKS